MYVAGELLATFTKIDDDAEYAAWVNLAADMLSKRDGETVLAEQVFTILKVPRRP